MAVRNMFAVRTFEEILDEFLHLSNYSDCIPKDQCKPLDKLTPTQIGFKSAVDATGCCPVAKLVCDKSLCPNRPSQCAEAFYTVKTLKTAAETNCCDEYACGEFY